MSGTSTGWANGRPVLAVPMGLVISGRSAALHTATTPASARETAVPLGRRWRRVARIERAVAEIASPEPGLTERGEWLRAVMARRWSEVSPDLRSWRRGVVDALSAIAETSVVVSHYIAINVAVGEATGDDRVVGFAPDNCSVTIVDVEDGSFRLVERGAEAATRVL